MSLFAPASATPGLKPALSTRNPLSVSRSAPVLSPPPPDPSSLPQQRLASLRRQVEALRTRVDALQRAKLDSIDWRATGYAATECTSDYGLRLRARLNGGHSGRLTALSWAGDNASLASVATDGSLVLWNAVTGTVECAVELPGADVPTCVDVEKERDDGLVVVGGLNHVCHVYRLDRLRENGGRGAKRSVALPAALGYLSCARIMSHERVLTGSADGCLRAWDLTMKERTKLDARCGPVLCAAVLPQEPEVCASGAADGRVRVWDTRLPEWRACVLSFGGFVGGVEA